MNKVEKIKTIPIMDVFERYGFTLNRAGFCRCPFHQERTPSCKVYADSFYCFGCGAHGDSIDFVRQYEKVGFRDAVDRLCNEFGISDDPRSMAQRIADGKRAFIKQKELNERGTAYAELRRAFNDSIDRLRLAETVFRLLEPRNIQDEWGDEFYDAMKNLEMARINADNAMDDLTEYENLYLH